MRSVPGRGVVGGRAESSASGFTLIEMMIASALMALILVSAYACLDAGHAARRILDPRVDVLQTGRVVLGLMAADVRSACALSKETEFVGADRTVSGVEADGMDLGTHHHTPRGPGEGDFCQTSYFVEPDEAGGDLVLWRRRNPRFGLDPLAGGSRERLAAGVRGLKLEYYDGFEWFNTWGDAEGRRQARAENSLRVESNLTGLPTAVRMTLRLRVGPARKNSDGTPDLTAAAEAPTGGKQDGPGEEVVTFQTVVMVQVPSTGQGGGPVSAEPSTGDPGAGGVPATGPPGGS